MVRLSCGERRSARAYPEKPVEFARNFVEQGANWLHVVDLDAAFGTGNNFNEILEIASLEGVNLQVGGGIRCPEQAERLLNLGVKRIVVGTSALDAGVLGEFVSSFGRRVWTACDLRNNSLAVEGWTKNVSLTAGNFLYFVSRIGVGGAVVTDVTRDGLLKGISKTFFKRIRAETTVSLIASGGVSSLEDLRFLAACGYQGAILGRAVYERRFSLAEASKVVENAC